MTRCLSTTLATVVAALACAAPAASSIHFDFHRLSNTDSRLTISRIDDYDGRVLNQVVYRAGSGASRDECESGRGWLPAGYYNLWGHYHHYDFTIKGRVWYLQDKACWNGIVRRALFIHSEETASNGQDCDGSVYTDDPYSWEAEYDYYSAGCIKISRAAPYPSDLAKLHAYWDNWSGPHGGFNLYRRLYVS